MKPFISLMNAQSFYYLWQNNKGKAFLEKIISSILNQNDNYKLLDTFNYHNIYLRSFIFLESPNRLILVDFNHNHQDNTKLNYHILKFLRLTEKKNVTMIIFDNHPGKNKIIDENFFIYRNSYNSKEIKLLMSRNYQEQLKYNQDDIIEYIYSLGKNFYKKYLKEYEKEENIYNLLEL